MTQGAYKGLGGLSEAKDPYIGLEFNGREYLLLFLCYAKKYVAQDSHKPCVGVSLCFELCAYIGNFIGVSDCFEYSVFKAFGYAAYFS